MELQDLCLLHRVNNKLINGLESDLLRLQCLIYEWNLSPLLPLLIGYTGYLSTIANINSSLNFVDQTYDLLECSNSYCTYN